MCFDYKVQGAGAGGGIHEFRMLFKPARWSVDFCLRKSEGGGELFHNDGVLLQLQNDVHFL